MFTKEIDIIKVFEEKPWEGFTFKQVKTLSKHKSDNYVHTTLKKLVSKDILTEKRYGNSNVYYVANTLRGIRAISIISEYKTEEVDIPKRLIEESINILPTSFLCVIITGSYALGKQRKDSDLDMVILCNDEKNKKEILIPLKNKGELSIPEIHPYVFTEKEFYEMLINKEQNYGKEIIRKHLIILGAQSFYKILFKAIENGFKG